MRPVAILCARPGSVYHTVPCCDVFDAARDAFTFPGGLPVVAHPPCRLFSRLSAFARPADAARETALALFCVGQVRANGGVLEHPAASKLWSLAGLPQPGESQVDGFTLAVPQFWFGHQARKDSWFFVSGLRPAALPEMPFRLESDHCRQLDRLSRKGREGTPAALAAWLVETARRTSPAAVAA